VKHISITLFGADGPIAEKCCSFSTHRLLQLFTWMLAVDLILATWTWK